MNDPEDMSASKVSRSMFISDPGDRCLWRVQMPGGGISRWEMDGTPGNLSITSSDELFVVVLREDRYYLNLFSCLDVTRTQSTDSADWSQVCTARSSVVEWKYYHPSFDRELPRCVSDQWTVDRWKELHPDFRSSIGSVDEYQELGSPSFIVRWWRTFIRRWPPPQQSLSVEFSTDGSSDSLEAVSTSTPWTAETLSRTREATVDRWSGRRDRRTRSCLCVQCSSTTTFDEHRTWTRTERWTITKWLTPDEDTNTRVRHN